MSKKKLTSSIAKRVKKDREAQIAKANTFTGWKEILRENKITYKELQEEYEKYFKKEVSIHTLTNAFKIRNCHKELFDEIGLLMVFIKSELELIDVHYAHEQ